MKMMKDELRLERMHKSIEKAHKVVEKDYHKDTYYAESQYFFSNVMEAAEAHDPERVDKLLRNCYLLGVYRGMDKSRNQMKERLG